MSSLTVINGLQSEIFVPVTPPPCVGSRHKTSQ